MERWKYKKVWIVPCVRFEELVTDVIPNFLNRRFMLVPVLRKALGKYPFLLY